MQQLSMAGIRTPAYLLTFLLAVAFGEESVQPAMASIPDHSQAQNSLVHTYDEDEDVKRGWRDMPSSGWGKRALSETPSDASRDYATMKLGLLGRQWGDLPEENMRDWTAMKLGLMGRGWTDEPNLETGKRGWSDMPSAGWGKRSWKDLSSAGWGKRGWQDLQGSWGKRSISPSLGDQFYYRYTPKRTWNALKGSWGKRDPAWQNLKGLWGKRSVDDIISSELGMDEIARELSREN